MKKLIALFLLCIVILPVGLTVAASDGVITVQERIVTLPQDQTTWYVSLFGDTNDLKFQELKVWFKTNEGLANLKKQVHYNEYTTDQVRYDRYAEGMPGLPCIRIQNGEGVICSEFWNDNVPMTSEALFHGICGDLKDKTSWGCLKLLRRNRYCPFKQHPQPQPQPQPLPEPSPDLPIGPPEIVPQPEPEPENSGLPWLLILLGGLVGGGLGFAQEYKREHLDKKAPKQRKL